MRFVITRRTKGSDNRVVTVCKKINGKVNKVRWNLETLHYQAEHIGIDAVKSFTDILKKDKKRLVIVVGILNDRLKNFDRSDAVTSGKTCVIVALKNMILCKKRAKSTIHN